MTDGFHRTTGTEPDTAYGGRHLTSWAPERKAKATIVLVHGLAEHAGRYERTGCLLAQAGYMVVAPDLYGFGRTGGDRAYVSNWSDYWEQVAGLITDARSSEQPIALMGHSMGGLVAASYGLSDKPQPDYLILSAPALGGGAWWQRKLAPVLAATAPKLEVPNALKGEQLSRDPDVGAAYFADPLVHIKTTAKLGNEMFGAQDYTKARLHEWHLPTLVLHGGADTIVPPQSTATLADLPTIERRLYPKLRHEILNEPEGPALVAEIIDWLDAKLETRAASLPKDENLP